MKFRLIFFLIIFPFLIHAEGLLGLTKSAEVELKKAYQIYFNFEKPNGYFNIRILLGSSFTPKTATFVNGNNDSLKLEIGRGTHIETRSSGIIVRLFDKIKLSKDEQIFFSKSIIKFIIFSSNNRTVKSKIKTKKAEEFKSVSRDYWTKVQAEIVAYELELKLEAERKIKENARRVYVLDSIAKAEKIKEKREKLVRDSLFVIEKEERKRSYSIDCEYDSLLGFRICEERNKLLSEGNYPTDDLRISVMKIRGSYFIEWNPNGDLCVNSKSYVIILFADGERMVMMHNGEVDCGLDASVTTILNSKQRKSFKVKKITQIMVIGALRKGGIYKGTQINNKFLGRLLVDLELK